MLKKITIACCLLVLLSTMTIAAPAKGKFVFTVPMISAQGLVWMGSGYDGDSFGDDGGFYFFGSSQVIYTPGEPYILSAPWSLGYLITDNFELGLNIGYFNFMQDSRKSLLNLGLYAAYYLNLGNFMPFLKVGLTRIDIKKSFDPSKTLINSSVGVAYALTKTVAPYLSLDFDTIVDTGTMVSVTLGLKFMF